VTPTSARLADSGTAFIQPGAPGQRGTAPAEVTIAGGPAAIRMSARSVTSAFARV